MLLPTNPPIGSTSATIIAAPTPRTSGPGAATRAILK